MTDIVGTLCQNGSLPVRERGLKSVVTIDKPLSERMSLPVRERGLKWLRIVINSKVYGASLPVRERGLKSQQVADAVQSPAVALCKGAWIEIKAWFNASEAEKRRSL